ncbi:glycosyltransferase family 1 protein [Ramaria rubella]|nr:glycosyltransferase family 1 protein [Ramaria rubella]
MVLEHSTTIDTTTDTTTDTTIDRTSSYYDPTVPSNEPWLFGLLNHAAAFEDVLNHHENETTVKSSYKDQKRPSADVLGLLGHDLASMAGREPSSSNAQETHTTCWKNAAPQRWANLRASSYLHSKEDAGLAGGSASDSEDEGPAPHDAEILEEPEPVGSTVSPEDVGPVLSSKEKVALMVSEFGALADPDEEEELIAEMDASFFQDVAILGVLHLTTHRLAFHASLLSTRPDLALSKQTIHSGPAVVRKGPLNRKRRVWLELSHDMITTFRKSDERSRVRPLRTVLLCAFRKIYPVDPRKPHTITFEFCAGGGHAQPRTRSSSHSQPQTKPKPTHSISRSFASKHGLIHKRSRSRVRGDTPPLSNSPEPSPERTNTGLSAMSNDDDGEDTDLDCVPGTVVKEVIAFDTEEAAMGWRRELQAALYMFRSHRHNLLKPPCDASMADGVRISIPLAKIRAHQIHPWPNFATVLQLDLGQELTGPTHAGGFGAGIGDLGDGNTIGDLEASSPITRGWLSDPLHHADSRSSSPSRTPALTDSPSSPALTLFPTTPVSSPTSHKHDHTLRHAHTISTGEDLHHPAPPPILDPGPPSAKLQFALLRPDPTWNRFGEISARARAPPDAKAIVDFGPLTFVEPGLDVGDTHDEGSLGEVAEAKKEAVHSSREKEVRKVFGLQMVDVWITKCNLDRVISTSGLLVVSTRFICFWSRLVAASDVKLRFHTEDVRGTTVSKHGAGLILHVSGLTDLFFDFPHKAERDTASRRINALIVDRQTTSATCRPTLRPGHRPPPLHSLSAPPAADTTLPTPPPSATALLSPMSRTVAHLRGRTFPPAALALLAKPINVPSDIPFGISPRHFICLTIGSRGDVQPYIALGRGLQASRHRVTIVTHEEYKEWIEGFGLEHRTAGGDPGALMKLSVEHKMFSPQFFKESIGNFRTWIDALLLEAWEHCQDADVLIESPPAMAGVHIAEALNIPYFRAFTMPWSKTAEYPHPFITPPVDSSARFNTASYVLFDNVFWLGTSGQINRWRKKHLGLAATDMGHMAQAKIPFVYNFSPSVVPKPLDWGDQISISGYWFLDNPDLDWTPPEALLEFMAKAKTDGKPLVYIGFGSITVPDARAMTKSIVKAVLKSDVRAILSKGWSSRMSKDDGQSPEEELPPEIYTIDKAPHDWLFPQMTAALHHGGAGTTGASLRAGIPTLIKPWFGDQFFWASRVQRLGAGLKVSSLHSGDLADALKRVTTDRVMQETAAAVGEKICQEDGVSTAIKAIYTYLDRAGKDRKTLKH